MIQPVAIDAIHARPDARAVAAKTVAALAESIAAVGLINPIRVRAAGDGFEVIAGRHRVEACRSLGLAEIDAVVVTDDDLHAELAMIDENLCRAELSPAERASQTARRKELYEALHPETGHGRASPNKVANFATFSAEVASVTGESERVIRLHAERGAKVIPEVLDMIRGTHLDKGQYLDKLKKLPPNEQVAAARRDLRQPKPKQKPIVKAPLDAAEVMEKQVERLMSAWNAAGPEAREAFLDAIDAEPHTLPSTQRRLHSLRSGTGAN